MDRHSSEQTPCAQRNDSNERFSVTPQRVLHATQSQPIRVQRVASVVNRRRSQTAALFRQQRERQQGFQRQRPGNRQQQMLSEDIDCRIPVPAAPTIFDDNFSSRVCENQWCNDDCFKNSEDDESTFQSDDDEAEEACSENFTVGENNSKQRDFFYWRNQQAKIDALLAQSNLERVEMPSDGNCLFHAVASFFDSFTTHREVRRRICDYIDANRERFEIDVVYSGYASIDKYLQMMRRDREWGDAIMLNAFCLSFNINVVLFTPDGFSEMYPGDDRAKMALVAFGQHYTATRVRSGPVKRLKEPISDSDVAGTDLKSK